MSGRAEYFENIVFQLQAHHMSSVAARTADVTPFDVKVVKEYHLPEARAYCAKFDEATKEQIEQQAEVASVETAKLYDHYAIATVTNDKVPWGLARISSSGKVPTARPYSYQYEEAASGQGVIAYMI